MAGVDGSRASYEAVLWALAEARRRASWVLLVHAAIDAQEVTASERSTPSRAGARVVQEHRGHATRVAPDVTTAGVVVSGGAPTALTGMSAHADLIVVGNRGREGLTESAYGPVGQRVAAHAHCPVVVVPQRSIRLATRRIALGVAATRGGDAALDVAADEAERWSAVLVLIRAHGSAEPDHAAAQVALERAAARVRDRHPGLLVEHRSPADDATSALIAEAGEADLLVLGCRHTDATIGCRLGAVPTGVLAGVRCPVMLIGHPS